MNRDTAVPKIRNEHQRRITQGRLRHFERALEELLTADLDIALAMADAVADGYRHQIAELKAELAEYDAMGGGDVDRVGLSDVASLGDALIAARIARRWTQADLARALDMRPQQIQRYESTAYKTASLERLSRVSEALGLVLEGSARLRHAR